MQKAVLTALHASFARRLASGRLWLVALLGFGTLAGAEFATLPVAADTAILETSADFNLGAQSDLPAGTLGSAAGNTRSRILLRFDLSSALPTNAIVEFAVLNLVVVREAAGGMGSVFALHRMLQPWEEGTGTGLMPGGAAGTLGEPTWNMRAVGEAPWASPGAGPGEDFDVLPDASEPIAGVGDYSIELGPAAVRTLQDWLADPARNFGWILLSQSEETAKTARRFASRETPQASPTLVVRYALPPPQPTITDFALTDSELRLELEATAGVPYAWETRSDADVGIWELLQTIPAPTTSGPLVVTSPFPPGGQAFFRLRAGP